MADITNMPMYVSGAVSVDGRSGLRARWRGVLKYARSRPWHAEPWKSQGQGPTRLRLRESIFPPAHRCEICPCRRPAPHPYRWFISSAQFREPVYKFQNRCQGGLQEPTEMRGGRMKTGPGKGERAGEMGD